MPSSAMNMNIRSQTPLVHCGVLFALIPAALISVALSSRVCAITVEQPRPGIILTTERLAALRTAISDRAEPTYTAWLEVKKAADAALTRKAEVPEVWHVPGYYGNQEAHRAAKQGLLNDANAAYTLALAYQMTVDDRYGAAAARFITAWMGLQELSQKADSTLCFSYHFPPLIFAADLLRNSKHLPAEQDAAFGKFLVEKALPMNTMKRGNNWGNWGLVLFTAIAAYRSDSERIDEAAERWKQLIDKQVAADGTLSHEVKRNGGRSGLWYSHFSLFPQTIVAETLRLRGKDLYDYQSASGRSLRLAYKKLAPWSLKPETFPYWNGDPAELHGYDYASYFELLEPRWPTTAGRRLLEKLRPLTARHGLPWITFTHAAALRETTTP